MKHATVRLPLFTAVCLLLLAGSVRAGDTDLIYGAPAAAESIYAEPVNLIAADVLAAPGRETMLLARVERLHKKIFKSVSDAEVEFWVAGSTVGRAATDRSGTARLSILAPEEGSYLLAARAVQSDLFRSTAAYAHLLVHSSTRPILLVDFDSSLYRGLSGRFQFAGIERLRPVAGAAEVLARLSERYTLIYLTGWEMDDLPKIRRWIGHWKLPRSPVLFWNEGGKVLEDANWKSRQLAKLLRDWRNVRIGVGGTSDVMRAFRSGSLKSIPIRTSYLQEPGALGSWQEVEAEILKREKAQ